MRSNDFPLLFLLFIILVSLHCLWFFFLFVRKKWFSFSIFALSTPWRTIGDTLEGCAAPYTDRDLIKCFNFFQLFLKSQILYIFLFSLNSNVILLLCIVFVYYPLSKSLTKRKTTSNRFREKEAKQLHQLVWWTIL